MKIILYLALICSPAYALDLKEIVSTLKKKLSLEKEEKRVLKSKIQMPKIPQVKKEATSSDVYNKEGAIYKQGSAFHNLSTKEKRDYRVAFVQELYIAVFESDGSIEQIRSAVNVLEQGGAREGVYRSLVLGDEYASFEKYDNDASKKLVDYVIKFGEKYLHRKFKKELLSQINLYGIKRILTEKSLELVDSFPKDGKDLRAWYAIVSSDMAKDFPQVWKGKVRKSIHPEVHFKWSGVVPLQHIKSELIIKLHKALNTLQK